MDEQFRKTWIKRRDCGTCRFYVNSLSLCHHPEHVRINSLFNKDGLCGKHSERHWDNQRISKNNEWSFNPEGDDIPVTLEPFNPCLDRCCPQCGNVCADAAGNPTITYQFSIDGRVFENEGWCYRSDDPPDHEWLEWVCPVCGFVWCMECASE